MPLEGNTTKLVAYECGSIDRMALRKQNPKYLGFDVFLVLRAHHMKMEFQMELRLWMLRAAIQKLATFLHFLYVSKGQRRQSPILSLSEILSKMQIFLRTFAAEICLPALNVALLHLF
jgi:hypothetical protein